MTPETAAWLANVRAEATAPGVVYVAIVSSKRTVAIFPEEIVGKADDELLAYVRQRLAEQ